MAFSATNKDIIRRIRILNENRKLKSAVLTHEEIALKEQCEKCFYTFIKTFWHAVEGDNQYIDNWHIRDMARHLQVTTTGRIKTLIINIPPRFSKSMMCNVMFPSWLWTHSPHNKIFCLTGDKDLGIRDSLKCRQIIDCELYQKFWGHKFQLRKDSNTKSRYANTRGGERMLKAIRGNAIGHGGHYLIIDDINRAEDIIYKTQRDRTNAQLETSVLIRRDNADAGVLIVIMQRLHSEDAAAMILAKNYPNTVHLKLPLEFVPEDRCTTVPLADDEEPWCDPRTQKNELLWPSRFSRQYIDTVIKPTLRTRMNISSQLQQEPVADGGNIYLEDWFNMWHEDKLPPCEFIIQSWDTAISTSVEACESACSVWGIFRTLKGMHNIILLDIWTGKLEHPQLRQKIIDMSYRNYPKAYDGPAVDMVLIEKGANGMSMVQDLNFSGIPVFLFDPRIHGLKNSPTADEAGKVARARAASILVEQGLVWIPCKQGLPVPGAQRMLNALLGFPASKDIDLVDSCSQAFIEIRKRELIYLESEMPPPAKPNWKDDPNLQKYLSPNLTYDNTSPL